MTWPGGRTFRRIKTRLPRVAVASAGNGHPASRSPSPLERCAGPWSTVRLGGRRPVVFDAFALRQRITAIDDIILMREDVVLILNTTVGRDEAVLFFGIEPFHRASLPARRLPLLRRPC